MRIARRCRRGTKNWHEARAFGRELIEIQGFNQFLAITPESPA